MGINRLALPRTALWMASARLGPIGAGLAAAITLPPLDYGTYVVALAWLGGLVSVLASAAQALAARAHQDQPASHNRRLPIDSASHASQVLRQTIFVSWLVPVCLMGLFAGLGYEGSVVAALGFSGLFGAQNASLAAFLWGEKRLRALSNVAMVESTLTIFGVFTGSLWFGGVEGALWGLTLAGLVSWLGYGWAAGGAGYLIMLWRERSPTTHTLQGIMGPSLANGIAAAAGPAMALVIAAARDPASAALYGWMMLLIAGCLFPIQILGIALAPPLISMNNTERARLGASSLGISMVCAVGVSWGLIILGPSLSQFLPVDGPPLDPKKVTELFNLAAWIFACLCPVVLAGPIVQANRHYWTWAAINGISAAIFVIAACLLPLDISLALQACLASAIFRLSIGLPLAGLSVVSWLRRI